MLSDYGFTVPDQPTLFCGDVRKFAYEITSLAAVLKLATMIIIICLLLCMAFHGEYIWSLTTREAIRLRLSLVIVSVVEIEYIHTHDLFYRWNWDMDE